MDTPPVRIRPSAIRDPRLPVGAEDGPARLTHGTSAGAKRFFPPPASFIIHHLSFIIFLFLLAGCHQPFDHYSQTLQAPVPEELEPPREISKVSLPAYRVEPPDLLQVEMLKMVPKPPYRIELYDVLSIQASGTLWDQPIRDFFLVQAEGTVNLGPAYGSVRVAGMTIDEAEKAIVLKLKEILREPQVSVQLSRTAGTQPVTGEYLVGLDGTINLRTYGVVHVAGKTVPEIQVALEKHLAQFFDSPEVSVDVLGYNSKVYYVIADGGGTGDILQRFPITGNETVLDALARMGGVSQYSSKTIWVARPAPGGQGCEQILPVNYEAITQGGEAATNYQLLPGDRVFIAQDNVLSFNNTLAKFTAPIERMLGLGSLSTSAIRGFQTMGRNYNRQRSF